MRCTFDIVLDVAMFVDFEGQYATLGCLLVQFIEFIINNIFPVIHLKTTPIGAPIASVQYYNHDKEIQKTLPVMKKQRSVIPKPENKEKA